MGCVQKWYKVNEAFIFGVTPPLMDTFRHELISFLPCVWLLSCCHPYNLCRSVELSWTDTSGGEHAEHRSIYISFIVWYLTSVWLYLRSSFEGNDDDTAMSTMGTSAPWRTLQMLVITMLSSCGGDNLLGDGCGATCLRWTDAQCGFSCHRSGNVGYQEPHGGAKLARYPGGGEQMGLC